MNIEQARKRAHARYNRASLRLEDWRERLRKCKRKIATFERKVRAQERILSMDDLELQTRIDKASTRGQNAAKVRMVRRRLLTSAGR